MAWYSYVCINLKVSRVFDVLWIATSPFCNLFDRGAAEKVITALNNISKTKNSVWGLNRVTFHCLRPQIRVEGSKGCQNTSIWGKGLNYVLNCLNCLCFINTRWELFLLAARVKLFLKFNRHAGFICHTMICSKFNKLSVYIIIRYKKNKILYAIMEMPVDYLILPVIAKISTKFEPLGS
jgi:hypothetical protein